MADRPWTHNAYALRRDSRHRSRYIEIGHALIASDTGAIHHIYLDRLPIGGFTGHILLSLKGVKPPDPEAHPERPADGDILAT
jgi:hypothetical protein